jgi:hypothetical protein
MKNTLNNCGRQGNNKENLEGEAGKKKKEEEVESIYSYTV